MNHQGETRPASEGNSATLQIPLSSASSPDIGPGLAPLEHHWSVLAAILLIVAAVAWSLLRQRRASSARH